MINQEIQAKIDKANELLIEARTYYEESNYNESELCSNQALTLLEPLAERDDLGEERDTFSQKYALIYLLAHAYNRLNVIAMSRYDFVAGLEFAVTGIVYAERIRDYSRVSQLYSNISGIYSELGEDVRAIEYGRKALAFSREQTNMETIALVLCNVGEFYRRIADYNTSLEYSHEALVLTEKNSILDLNCQVMGNIGVTYMDIGDYHQSLEYLSKALQVSINMHDKRAEGRWLGFLGQLYTLEQFDGYDDDKAIEFLQRSLTIIRELGIHEFEFRNSYKLLVPLFKKRGDTLKALEALEKYVDLEREVKNVEARKQATKFDYEHKTAEREKTLAIERALSKATKDILANILPPNITERLLNGEKKIADSHQQVSVLFIDIVGFTQLSAQLPARELIDLLDIIFSRFDTICKKYGLEKIKTIGDAYMAVCGAPVAVENHAERVARAALEMLENFAIEERFSSPINLGFRIGLHTGSVVAGIIGENKYSYDLWGDAVNTASRMESHGEEDKIHVSEEFVRALSAGAGHDLSLQPQSSLSSLLSFQSFRFIERGEMNIKGKGMMKTYFLTQSN